MRKGRYMKAVNEGSMLVAQALDLLKGYTKAHEEHDIWEIKPVEDSIVLLEKALEALASDIR